MSDHEVPAEDGASDTESPVSPRDTEESSPDLGSAKDPLRRSRVSHVWLGVVAFAAVLVLLIVFFAQNTDRVSVRFFGWTWHSPQAVVVLSGVVVGMVLTVIAGTMRIVQLRRRVRRSS